MCGEQGGAGAPYPRMFPEVARVVGGPGTPGFGDFVVQCDLLLVDLNGECGRMNSPTFGTNARTTAAIDPGILNGWSVRPADWQIGASIQQELMPRMSVEV